MVNLLEPTMYMLMAIAEKVGIEPVLTRDDNEVIIEDDDEQNNLQDLEESKIFQDFNVAFEDTSKLKESILQKQKPALQTQESLLGKTGV
mgnify:CR=1 FL=1